MNGVLRMYCHVMLALTNTQLLVPNIIETLVHIPTPNSRLELAPSRILRSCPKIAVMALLEVVYRKNA